MLVARVCVCVRRQYNQTLEDGKAIWRLLVLRRYFRAMRDFADERINTRMAATLCKRFTMNKWKRLHGIVLEETFYAVKIQCAWRVKQSRRKFLRELRLYKLKEHARMEKEAAVTRRVDEARARLARFVYTWIDDYKAKKRAEAFQRLILQRAAYERKLAEEAEVLKREKMKLCVAIPHTRPRFYTMPAAAHTQTPLPRPGLCRVARFPVVWAAGTRRSSTRRTWPSRRRSCRRCGAATLTVTTSCRRRWR